MQPGANGNPLKKDCADLTITPICSPGGAGSGCGVPLSGT
jgi:hypothetical protein